MTEYGYLSPERVLLVPADTCFYAMWQNDRPSSERVPCSGEVVYGQAWPPTRAALLCSSLLSLRVRTCRRHSHLIGYEYVGRWRARDEARLLFVWLWIFAPATAPFVWAWNHLQIRRLRNLLREEIVAERAFTGNVLFGERA